MIGVAVATMAITIVLSVFNGFSQLAASHLSVLDPEAKITPAVGKTIADADSLARSIEALPYVAAAMPAVEERGLVIIGNQQMPVHFKGVADGYEHFTEIDSIVLEGQYSPTLNGLDATLISSGVAMKTGARSYNGSLLSLYVPRRMGRINPANPGAAFSGTNLIVSGIYQIGQAEYDLDHIFVSLEQARQLLQYTTEATAIEVKFTAGTDADQGVRALSALLGDGYKIATRFEQQEDAFRMIQIEKWVTFLMLAFILVIASFNIISTLSLLVIEKRSNMATLRALGAPMRLVRRIFIIQGWLISVVGGIAGIALGTVLTLCQEHFGWIKLSGDPTHLSIPVYPVELQGMDLLIVFSLVVIVGLLTSQVTRLFTTTSSINPG